MPTISRRSLFALPLVAPLAMAVAGVIAGRASAHPTPANAKWRAAEPLVQPKQRSKKWPRTRTPAEWAEYLEEEARFLARWPSDRDLAATLGIKHEEPPEPYQWTDADVAATLGIDVQRDGISAVEALHRFVDRRSARRVMLGDLLDGKGGV